jgi:hypothetical protein
MKELTRCFTALVYTFAYLSPLPFLPAICSFPSAGLGNCNATVTPETTQAICKGSRDDFVDCCNDYNMPVDTLSWLGDYIIVAVATFAQSSLISAAASASGLIKMLLSCLTYCRDAETASETCSFPNTRPSPAYLTITSQLLMWSVTHVFACREAQKRTAASSIIPRMFFLCEIPHLF